MGDKEGLIPDVAQRCPQRQQGDGTLSWATILPLLYAGADMERRWLLPCLSPGCRGNNGPCFALKGEEFVLSLQQQVLHYKSQ